MKALKAIDGITALLITLPIWFFLLFNWWKSAPDSGNAWLLTAAFVVMMAGAIFLHGDWLATWFAFLAAFFAWRVVIVKKLTAKSKARETDTASAGLTGSAAGNYEERD